MATTADPTGIGDLDWSKFDFTRWNLDGLPIDNDSAAIASLLQKVISSPQWPQAFGSNLPTLKTAVVQQLTLQVQALQERSAALDRQLAARTSAVQAQITAVQEMQRAASLPPAPATDPNRFQFVAKAVDQASQLGLPGLTVQLLDPRKPGNPIATGTTDANGNVVLSLNKDQAEGLANDKVDLTLTILNSAGKVLRTAPNSVCSHANHVESQVATIASSSDTAAGLALATLLSARNSTLLTSLNAKLAQLPTLFANRKQDVQTKITQIQDTITAIQAELNPLARP